VAQLKQTTNMKAPNASIKQLAALAKAAAASNRWLALFGKGGVGKTSVAKTIIAPAMGIDPADVWIVNLSGSGPQEALGYGIPDSGSRDLWFSAPEQWPTTERVGSTPTLLVLDEFPEWDVQIQSLCRSLFQPDGGSPMIGTHKLGKNVRVMLTGNRRSDGTRSAVPAAPIIERSMVFTINPTLDEWLEWAAIEGLAESPVYTFLKYANGVEGVDHFNPDTPSPWDGSPHPCPRQWEAACRVATGDLLEEPALLSLSLRGLVGEASGSAAYAFCQTIASMLTKLIPIRNGDEKMPTDRAEQYAISFAALRKAKQEVGSDPEAAVASGAVDWLVNNVICATTGEIRKWTYDSAVRNGIPLNQHPRRSAMQGI
jgi:hypothetical protein